MTPKYKQTEKGFFSVQFLFFISLISVTLMSYGYVFYAQKQKDLFRKTCYFDLADIQKNLVQSEKKLFLLNPESSALRLRLKILYLELAFATAAQNYALVTKIGLDIQTTVALQKKLDLVQKLIIYTADSSAKFQLYKLNSDLIRQYQFEKKIWDSLLQEKRNFNLKLNPVLAVRPDSLGGLAPNYELSDDYQRLQRLQLNLQYQFSNRRQGQTVLKTQQSYQFSCDVSFTRKDQLWDLNINQDKHLSKL
ncbi:MAG: hypothetical protein H7Z71_00270 [Moraxellaceae bacterium]|nr:hypothetical protein [Pseudobdellovibrionaceae bacterium]